MHSPYTRKPLESIPDSAFSYRNRYYTVDTSVNHSFDTSGRDDSLALREIASPVGDIVVLQRYHGSTKEVSPSRFY